LIRLVHDSQLIDYINLLAKHDILFNTSGQLAS